VYHWKRIIETADNLTAINCSENIVEAIRPTTLYEIALLPKEKQHQFYHFLSLSCQLPSMGKFLFEEGRKLVTFKGKNSD
jgi:hypothetical protein